MNLPTPEQERMAVRALIGCGLLAGFGGATVLVLSAWLLAKISEWVFA